MRRLLFDRIFAPVVYCLFWETAFFAIDYQIGTFSIRSNRTKKKGRDFLVSSLTTTNKKNKYITVLKKIKFLRLFYLNLDLKVLKELMKTVCHNVSILCTLFSKWTIKINLNTNDAFVKINLFFFFNYFACRTKTSDRVVSQRRK